MIVLNNYNFYDFYIFRHFSAVMIFCVSGESDNGFWRPPHFGRLHEGLEVLYFLCYNCWITKFNKPLLLEYLFKQVLVSSIRSVIMSSSGCYKCPQLLLTCSASRATFLGKRCVYQSRRD